MYKTETSRNLCNLCFTNPNGIWVSQVLYAPICQGKLRKHCITKPSHINMKRQTLPTGYRPFLLTALRLQFILGFFSQILVTCQTQGQWLQPTINAGGLAFVQNSTVFSVDNIDNLGKITQEIFLKDIFEGHS